MKDIHQRGLTHGELAFGYVDYAKGANIAGFKKSGRCHARSWNRLKSALLKPKRQALRLTVI
jgi:hypothetical protein